MAFVGIGAAMVPASMFPFAAKLSPHHKTGLYMGTIVASGTFGVIFGRVSKGIQTAAVGWKYSFRLVALVLRILTVVGFLILVSNNDLQPDNCQKLPQVFANSMRLFFVQPLVFTMLRLSFL